MMARARKIAMNEVPLEFLRFFYGHWWGRALLFVGIWSFVAILVR